MLPEAATALLGFEPAGGVVLNPETLEVVEFDDTGYEMWKALRASDSLDHAAEKIAHLYGVATAEVRGDLHQFLEYLNRVGLVTPVDPGATALLQPALPNSHQPNTDPHEQGPGGNTDITVVAILAAHNRRDLTVRCLRSLFAQVARGVALSAVLVDDGSTDGTREAVEGMNLDVTVVTGPGSWFWSRSMAAAERVAETADPDVILWLNDDVELEPDVLRRAMATQQDHPQDVLVGALWSPETAKVSYSGFTVDPHNNRLVVRVLPTREVQRLDNFHGNFVMIPRSARRKIGPIDRSWPHHYGDLDYAQRAASVGVRMRLLPGLIGACTATPAPWLDPASGPLLRTRSVLGRKGWPLGAQVRFMIRHRKSPMSKGGFALYWGAISGKASRKPRSQPSMHWLRPTPTHATTSSHFPAAWQPVLPADLIRVGPTSDGGYVVSKASVKATEHLLSGGLSADWAFEEAFRTLNPVELTVYDGTMGWPFWCATMGRNLRLRLTDPHRAHQLASYRKYRRFFAGVGARHMDRNLGVAGPRAVSMGEALRRTGSREVFVKLDVEGAEYACLGEIVKYRKHITGLAIEMHGVRAHEHEISQFIAAMDSHALTFVRANNAGGCDAYGRAQIVEMNWTRLDLFRPHAGPKDKHLSYRNCNELAITEMTFAN
jgi:GT2 family glycosyltransferase